MKRYLVSLGEDPTFYQTDNLANAIEQGEQDEWVTIIDTQEGKLLWFAMGKENKELQDLPLTESLSPHDENDSDDDD